MTTEGTSPEKVPEEIGTLHGNGSVAHQIIGEFLVELKKTDGYAEIADNLKKVILEDKPSEASLRIAMFGEDML
jgi:hypothetical protein